MDDRPLPRLSEVLAIVSRSWRVAVVLGLLGALAGFTVWQQTPVRYAATSEIALAPQLSYLSLSEEQERQPPVSLDTTAALLSSTVARNRIAEAMGIEPTEVADAMSITARPLSRVLIVRVASHDEAQAVAGANAATEALLAIQSDTLALRRQSIKFLRNRVSVLRAEAQERIADGTPAQSLFDVVNALQTRLDKAEASNQASSVVIDRARVEAYHPVQRSVLVFSGLALGLFTGFAWGAVRQRLPARGPRAHLGATSRVPA